MMVDAICMPMKRTPLSRIMDVALRSSDVLSDSLGPVQNFLLTRGHIVRTICNVMTVLDSKSSPNPKELRTLDAAEEG